MLTWQTPSPAVSQVSEQRRMHLTVRCVCREPLLSWIETRLMPMVVRVCAAAGHWLVRQARRTCTQPLPHQTCQVRVPKSCSTWLSPASSAKQVCSRRPPDQRTRRGAPCDIYRAAAQGVRVNVRCTSSTGSCRGRATVNSLLQLGQLTLGAGQQLRRGPGRSARAGSRCPSSRRSSASPE